ncbi:DinB family protein [Rubrivirga sp.]|uniref:DinB family protein n=1 Tax=Rubrivirga sp. TaxID=1885344 RepID=UPI003C75D237
MPSPVHAYAEVHTASQTRAHALIDDMSEATFNRRPAPQSWSVAECIVHLNIVADAYLPVLEGAVARADRRADGPFEYGFVAGRMRSGVVPGGPGLKTGKRLDPSLRAPESSHEIGPTMTVFDAAVERYISVCDAADGLDLALTKVRYPFMRLIRLPLGAFLDITGQHALRHIDQAERAASTPGVPS